MKITPFQQYLILGVAVFSGISFLYYQFLLKPINLEIGNLRSTLEQKQKDLEEAKIIVAKYVEFKKRADSVQRELEWIQNRVPKSIERTKLLETINLLQNKSGVYLTNFQLGNITVAKDAWIEIPTVIKFNTDFRGLLDFLYQVSLSSLFITVRDITVVPLVDVAHPNVTLTAQMTLCGIQAK